MKMIMLDEAGCGDILLGLLDVVIASRYDLLMLAIGLTSYFILFSIRTRWKVSCEPKKLCVNDVDNQAMLGTVAKSPVPCSDATYCSQIQSLSGKPEQVRTVVNDVLDRPLGSAFSFDLVLAILGFCRISLPDRPIVDQLLGRLVNPGTDVLSEFVHFYLDSYQLEKACDVFELNFAAFFEDELGEDTEWSLLHAALKCGRLSVANHLFETSQFETGKHVLTIQRWWRHSPYRSRNNCSEHEIGEIFGRLADAFNDRFPFEENADEDGPFAYGLLDIGSDDESTDFGDDDGTSDISDVDSDYDAGNWTFDE